jgi:hypothetical protein
MVKGTGNEGSDSQISLILYTNMFTMNHLSKFWISTKAEEMVKSPEQKLLTWKSMNRWHTFVLMFTPLPSKNICFFHQSLKLQIMKFQNCLDSLHKK